ncbi:glycosyltransferase [Pedobacter sp. AW31-3R]|uniref:glycosyltransferase n=1 Tax=Pedobacter sp. AW31-3R TaxID=3445781 RepID=UPI003FA064AD
MSTSLSSYPLVSIAICTYNGQKYLVEQLDSLVMQTYPNLEILAADDCSMDGTLKILEEYSIKYPFFNYYQNEHNLGYVKNFEQVIQRCKGDYIALCDQDDIWDPHKIMIQMNNIGEHALIYHDSSFIDENGHTIEGKLSDIYTLYEGKQPYPFLFFNCVSGHSLLFNKKLVRELIPFNEKYFHDRWIALIASERGGIKLIRKNLVKYRQHISSETDLLRLSNKPENNSSQFFNSESIFWIQQYSRLSIQSRKYIYQLLSCFDENNKIIRKKYLFYLLVSKQNSLFYTIKKSGLSSFNFIRKICFLPRHS